MSFESPNQEPVEGALDQKWYDQFKENFIEDYELMAGEKEHRDKEKNKFISGESENPNLDYPKINRSNLEEKNKNLIELKKRILAEEKNPVVAQTYRWRINEELAKVRMLLSTEQAATTTKLLTELVNNNEITEEERWALSNKLNTEIKNFNRHFAKYSEFIYGSPSPEVYEYTVQKIHEQIALVLEGQNDVKKDAAQRLATHLGIDTTQPVVPTKKETYFELVEDTSEVITSPEVVKEMFNEAVQRFGIEGWKVVIDEKGSRTNLSASQDTKTLHIPSEENIKNRSQPLTKLKIEALIAHEIETHALRRENGERSKLKILGLGLDRYLTGEEGVATYKQQEVEGAEDYAGLIGHLSISLAKGLDGTKRDFRQVFEILTLLNLVSSKDEQLPVSKAQNSAYNACIRVFRGTTPTTETAGFCFTKDIVYREGNMGVWRLVKDNPDVAHKFTLGKFDPMNQRHLWVLSQLGITEQDLETLENESTS